MATLVKNKLKAARDALGKKDWAAAQTAAQQALDFEADNYNANVFLGLASLELGSYEQSEQAYRKAIEAGPEQPLAWQGLNKFYERTENRDGYVETLQKLMHIFAKANDPTKCAEQVQRLVDLRREQGNTQQLIDALSLYLHSSLFYDVLSQLPPPDPTNPTSTTTFAAQCAMQDSLPIYEEILAITEKEEQTRVEGEVKQRRQRLGAGSPEQIRRDVDQEVLSISKLPKIYEEVISHPNTTDDLRRETEAKLLRHRIRFLHSLSASKDGERKKAASDVVDALVEGVVLLNIPDDLAWSMAIDGKNAESIEQYDYSLLQRYVALFPQLPLSKFIINYFEFSGLPLEDDVDEKSKPLVPNNTEDKFYDLLDAFNHLPNWIFAHRVIAELYIQQELWEDATKAAESGLELVRRSEGLSGKKLPLVRKAFNVVLGTGLVHFNPPKHHLRALGILDVVLEADKDNIVALMGRGYVMQSAKRWEDARELFGRVAALRPDDLAEGIRAKEEEAWAEVHLENLDIAEGALRSILETLDGTEERGEDKARCSYRLGRCLWARGGDSLEEAFKCFITALKRAPTFAPAFTSLGVYYAERANPPDPARASKCFQKAFELDPREADAARRLAEGFAEEREWDLVDVVARRTIEGEGGAEATGVAASRYLPTNAWAWKAVGAVELHRQHYVPAIEAFQIALRADPDDQLSWLRLGEAYSKAGRFAAALKALARAQELAPDDWMCAYFSGDVLRQTGQFAEAIAAFSSILAARPDEAAARMALAQAHLDLARVEELAGFEARAEASFIAAIQAALDALDAGAGLRAMAWKVAGDALHGLAQRSSYLLEDDVRAALGIVMDVLGTETSARLAPLFTLGEGPSEEPLRGRSALELALAAYDYRLALLAKDDHAYGSAWADLGVSLYAWTRTTTDSDRADKAQKEAVVSLTEALRCEPGAPAYWIALGDAQFVRQPKVAQHAYIRALEIDKTSVVPWTHLGLLYLQHDDLELANEALLRAQTLDPDHTLAWVGQALVATANKHDADAKALLEHALTLSADVPPADLEYASRLLAQLDAAHDFSPASVLPAFFALERYCRRRADDACASHLLGLVCERLGHLSPAGAAVARAIGVLEAAYELTEDVALERPFAIANASAGRIALAQGRHARALEAFDAARGLLADDVGEDGRLHALCGIGSGLACLRLGDVGDALVRLEAAREAVRDDAEAHTQATVVLAQALWSLGTDEAREAAKSHMLECITVDPENLAAITTLAGMGIVSGDAALVDAALSEILALPPARRAALDPARDVTDLLAQVQRAQGDAAGAARVYRDALAAEPGADTLRRQLAALVEPAEALEVLDEGAGAQDLDEARETVAVRALAAGRAGDVRGALDDAQKAVALAPWETRNWEVLAFVRSQPVDDDPAHGDADADEE